MTKSSLKSLLEGLLLLTLLGGASIVYLDSAFASSKSTSAKLHVQTYEVGTSYSGVVVKQLVAPGDTIRAGQPLFAFKSDELTAAIAEGKITANSLTYLLDTTGAMIISSSRSGQIAQINYPQGSFVPAAHSLAVITDATDLTINANFNLPVGANNRLSIDTPLTVTLPTGRRVNARITQLSIESRQGRRSVAIQARLSAHSDGQFTLDSSSPVQAALVLKSDTLYHQADVFSQNLLARWLK
jgi:hypothetical protein